MPVPFAAPASFSDQNKLLRKIGFDWAINDMRPGFVQDDAQAKVWRAAIERIALDADIPVLVRKQRNDRARRLTHEISRRVIVPTDNSPAHWSFTSAFDKRYSSADQIVEALKTGTAIPVAQVYPAGVAGHGYGVALNAQFSVNGRGWKLAHLKGIGLGGNQLIQARQLTTLIEHCRLFLSPDNLFVVPTAWAGLAEVPAFIEGFSEGIATLGRQS